MTLQYNNGMNDYWIYNILIINEEFKDKSIKFAEIGMIQVLFTGTVRVE